MKIIPFKQDKFPPDASIMLLISRNGKIPQGVFSKDELGWVKSKSKQEDCTKLLINQYKRCVFVLFVSPVETIAEINAQAEKIRRAAASYRYDIQDAGIEQLLIAGDVAPEMLWSAAEGIRLAFYSFQKYLGKKKKKEVLLKSIAVKIAVKEAEIGRLQTVCDAVCIARDMVNEPPNGLNAVQLSKWFQNLGKEAGFSVEVLGEAKIAALKMGGLLAVNKGSVDPPTFSIMEYKPAKALNKKPLVLVGKGLVFDSGGMNIKTGTNMDYMKSDMAGGAVVGALMFAIAKTKLPVHVIGLVPSTDNRLNGNAYVSGDVITMHNGLNVEVMNTDAEGRMILADALSFAEKFKPALVIDLATLTGSAAAALGRNAIAAFSTNDEVFAALENDGNKVHERVVRFPLWDDYDDLLKSDIADLKNIGGPQAGAITAAKFLQRFVSYPWVHLDIAGPAFIESTDSYRGIGGTGVGVRLLYDFILNHAKELNQIK
jgi:leucyl aminopeptidase